ncbi:MAG: hypothetical protein ACI3XR_02525 [Eubacteriales bacterium]
MDNKKTNRSRAFRPGMVVGNWTVLEVYPYDTERNSRPLLCRCVCGKEKLIRTNNIRHTVSCGCTKQRANAAPATGDRSTVGSSDPPISPGCVGCGRADRMNCSDYKNCEKWRSWFHEEWAAIRKAALGKE